MADLPLDEAAVAAARDNNAERWSDSVQAGYDRYRELFTLPAFFAFAPRIEGLEVIDLGSRDGATTPPWCSSFRL